MTPTPEAVNEVTRAFFDNTSEAPRNPKARDFTFYLDEIKKMGCEFEKLEAYCTDGDIIPPYPYQWRATTKYRVGEDEPHEGLGSVPIEAIHALYQSVKYEWENPYSEEDDND